MAEKNTFDPGRYLTKVGSADYLEVKWRIVWLRETNPDATIATELINHDPHNQHAIFKAVVYLPSGASATGYGSEDFKGFREYIEKAETKAIGRALAALGFGTQFCDDFVFGAEQGRVVDSPVANTNGHAPANLPPRGRTEGHNTMPANGNGQKPQMLNPDAEPTPSQTNYLGKLMQERGWTPEMADDWLGQHSGRDVNTMTRADTSALIDYLKNL